MTWWQWTILGGILLGAELLGLDAQFYLIFIGLSALLVGLAELMGIDYASMGAGCGIRGVFTGLSLHVSSHRL